MTRKSKTLLTALLMAMALTVALALSACGEEASPLARPRPAP